MLLSQLSGIILAVVSQAAYLLDEKGELFWLGTVNVPMHRRGLRLSTPLPQLSAGTPWAVEDHHLIIDSRTVLDFRKAFIWEEPHLYPDSILPVTVVRQRLHMVLSILGKLPVPAGFCGLIPEILRLIEKQGAPHPLDNLPGIQAKAWPAIRNISKACLAHNFPKIMEEFRDLIGLGEGLTPSGDDFIGGLLFCRKILRDSYPDILNLEFPSLPDFIESIRPFTNKISFAFLKDHAEGHGFEPIHLFANAFLTGQPDDLLHQILMDLTHIGHSTGWDLLTGFLVGILLAS